ncbi:hypothetical protein BCT86_09965 [Vibrio breoganii]|uniref:hypothetical protein n=1 Tax=Vibrio breoganii TaxID=553239 RepID=UPI000C851B83|nr:hypothetical protein [Vibrio breoganii]PML07195.1 hypothetical protein BCT86_09965 [Vibrio breoganii]PML61918.1 hypothetical protein BCT73_05915 [Vibrio breoganii]PMO81135.1 hypothetical protein BCT00_12380 [Vibrio breoganii]
MFEKIEDLKFVNWQDFGEVAEKSVNDTAFTTIKDYAQTIGFILGTRATRASQELMSLTKMFPFLVIQGSPNQYPYRVLEAIFFTVIVTAEERDIILAATAQNASQNDKQKAYHVLEPLLVEPPKFLLN